MRSVIVPVLSFFLSSLLVTPALAQPGYDADARLAAQREAMKKFDLIDGEWRGPAKSLRLDGGWHALTQAERVGSMLDGTVKVVEGRGYEADGSIGFNAFAVISYEPTTKTYSMRSWAEGRSGDFPITPTPDGFKWDIQAGPDMKIVYEATIKNGVWTEIGTRIPKNGPPVRIVEFSVTRLGDTTWPAGGGIPPR